MDVELVSIGSARGSMKADTRGEDSEQEHRPAASAEVIRSRQQPMSDLSHYIYKEASGVWEDGDLGALSAKISGRKGRLPYLYEVQQQSQPSGSLGQDGPDGKR